MTRIGLAMGISGMLLAAGTSLIGLWAVPLVVGDGNPAHEAERMVRLRRPGRHAGGGGEGFHHVCFEVDNLAETLLRLEIASRRFVHPGASS